jgi:hypothetical protein
MSKKFLIGVGNIFYYDMAENLLFQSKTMSTSGMEVSVSNTEISGGYGSVLQFNLIHSPRLNLSLTDTQWNLGYIAANVGSTISTNNDVWAEESCTLSAGKVATILGTPKVTPDAAGATIYGWMTHSDGTIEKLAFATKSLTSIVGASGDIVCVRYYKNDSAARTVQINSNFVPQIGRMVIETQLASSVGDVSSASIIGKVQFEIPRAQLSGSQNIEMSSDGYSNSPLSASAIAYDTGSGSCTTGSYLAKITEILDNGNWYDEVLFLAPADPDIDLLTTDSPVTMQIWAIPASGSAFVAPNADLDFTSGTVGTCTAGLHTGIITVVGAGSSLITVAITAKTSVQCAANVTISTP